MKNMKIEKTHILIFVEICDVGIVGDGGKKGVKNDLVIL
jgi:hypothetical protein